MNFQPWKKKNSKGRKGGLQLNCRVLASKEGVVLRSKDICGFSDHIKGILPQKGGGEGSPLFG